MSELKLILTEGFFRDNLARELHEDLNACLSVGNPKEYLRRSVDPSQAITLIGDVVEWLPLKEAATTYLNRLAECAADLTMGALGVGLYKLYKLKKVEPLANFAKALKKASIKVNGEVEICIGLPIPDDFFGTTLKIKEDDLEDILYFLAIFIFNVEDISEILQKEFEDKGMPFGSGIIKFESKKYFIVSWCSKRDYKKHEKRIPCKVPNNL